MMPDDFRQYAELWQEQVEPGELADLQAMAKKIERTARRKRLFDVAVALGFAGAAFAVLWKHPASLQVKFGYFFMVAVCFLFAWWRHRITVASRATFIDDPRVFFDKAIKNLRDEINLSTTSTCLGTLAAILSLWLAAYLVDLTVMEVVRKLYDHVPSRIILIGGLAFGSIYFIRDNIKIRRQLRRLESMRREWDEPQATDAEDGS